MGGRIDWDRTDKAERIEKSWWNRTGRAELVEQNW
jgi:hypothetical protein